MLKWMVLDLSEAKIPSTKHIPTTEFIDLNSCSAKRLFLVFVHHICWIDHFSLTWLILKIIWWNISLFDCVSVSHVFNVEIWSNTMVTFNAFDDMLEHIDSWLKIDIIKMQKKNISNWPNFGRCRKKRK